MEKAADGEEYLDPACQQHPFINAYFHFDSGEKLNLEPMFLFLLTIGILVITNIHLVIHSMKVDGAQSPVDFKGIHGIGK